MKLIVEDNEIEELKIEDVVKSNDRGLVIVKGEKVGKRAEGNPDFVKEIIAIDAIELGSAKAAEIHGVPQSSASKYSDGKDIADDDTRARVLSKRHSIADVAITKLMDSLDLIDISEIEKMRDKVTAVSQLASVVDKITPKNNSSEVNNVHLHLYGPKQKSLEQFETIDV